MWYFKTHIVKTLTILKICSLYILETNLFKKFKSSNYVQTKNTHLRLTRNLDDFKSNVSRNSPKEIWQKIS